MRLFDFILDANRRALAGDTAAGIHVADFADELPVIALTCIDPRLNRLFPGVLALPDEQFIWLRNAGNIITGPLSSTMRSIALACALKGGREIVLIGHTDCKVRHTTVSELTERFRALGIDRSHLPENIAEFFGVFASERQNVVSGVDFIRQSPLIGPQIPVHGLIVNVQTGQLEWLVNGYEVLGRPTAIPGSLGPTASTGVIGNAASNRAFDIGEMKFPETRIGEMANAAIQKITELKERIVPSPPAPAAPAPPPLPPPPGRTRAVPIPPPIRLHPGGRDERR